MDRHLVLKNGVVLVQVTLSSKKILIDRILFYQMRFIKFIYNVCNIS